MSPGFKLASFSDYSEAFDLISLRFRTIIPVMLIITVYDWITSEKR